MKDADLLQRVNDAVRRGSDALLARATHDGRWETEFDTIQHGPFPHGGTALAVYTLLKCGWSRYDPRIEDGLKCLKERWDDFLEAGLPVGQPTSWKTYEVGIALQMLEALDRWRPLPQHRRAAVPVATLTPAQRAWVRELRDFLVDQQAIAREVVTTDIPRRLEGRREAWSYPSQARFLTDHSNTLFAVEGLKSAARLGHHGPADLWIRVLEGFLFTQAADGDPVHRFELDRRQRADGLAQFVRLDRVTDRARGWGYNGADKPVTPGTGQMAETGSMTCAGIACVAIAWSEIERLAAVGDEMAKAARRDLAEAKATSLHDGFAWLARNWTVTENPNYRTWHYYYLAGLERAGVLTNTENVGAHDWYREGAARILVDQRGGGLWDDGNGDGVVVSTCFALQFLTRATIPLRGH